jgi:endonuclease V-like protein UPF0215 family
MTVKFRRVKSELRVLGIDDAPFSKEVKGETLLVGTVFRGGTWCDGILTTKIQVDGMEVTEKIIAMVNRSRHKEQLRVIMLDGITFGGMNIADINKIYKKTGLPVIVVNRKYPNYDSIKKALDNFEDGEKRWEIIQKSGDMTQVTVKEHKLYIQIAGIKVENAKEILRTSCTRSYVPESLRVAHLIAAGVVKGESKGGA